VSDTLIQSSQTTEVKPGDVLGGKFRIERVLGQGGMGVVVEAFHLQLEQRVALKFLLPGALAYPETVARFAREARAAAKIRSEHVARVIDVGALDTGSPYIVMEYLEGQDLSQLLRARGSVTVAEATAFVLQACEALAEAHAAGIVHRDLKPANLFLARYPDGTPCVKILDFGISKISGGSSGRDFDMTRTTAILGSPFYMSPEQMRSTRAVDARADIWALGVILYELVSGRVPFDADTMPQLCGMVLQEAPAPLTGLTETGFAAFERVVLRCLEKDTGARYQSVAELAEALALFAPPEAQRSLDRVARLSGAPSGPRRGAGSSPPNAPVAVPATSTSSLTQTDFGGPARRGASPGLLLGVGIAVLALTGVGVALWQARPATDPAAATTAAETVPPAARPAEAVAPTVSPRLADSTSPAASAPASSAPFVALPRAPAASITPNAPKPNRPATGASRKPAAASSASPPATPVPVAPTSRAPNPLDGRM
jgi:eukaryotic-like serine/threonine-protein kinase